MARHAAVHRPDVAAYPLSADGLDDEPPNHFGECPKGPLTSIEEDIGMHVTDAECAVRPLSGLDDIRLRQGGDSEFGGECATVEWEIGGE